jgi:hypothetical protein|tara:strand:+ start:1247 stop:1909 length:663 start_codon:yes stop_codon:yes gene_type:complete
MIPELEVYLTTYDGAQHLRLHGWLKRNSVLIKSETIHKTEMSFGMFMVYVGNDILDKLKKANLEQGMYCDMDVMGNESSRLDLFKRSNPEIKFDDEIDDDSNFPRNEDGFDIDKLEDIDKYSSSIKSFMFSLDLQSPEDIDNFIKQANETSLKLFKREDEFTEEYIQTNALSTKEKIKDIEIMIEYFIENGERYEDCALLHKIKTKILNYEINNLYKITN